MTDKTEEKTTSALDELKETFMNFCTFGDKTNQGQLDNKKFSKLAKDCKLVDKSHCTTTDIDLIFTKIKPKGGRTVSFKLFQEGIEEIAKKKFADDYKSNSKSAVAKVIDLVIKQKVPVSSGTKADKVKFYDDKSTYTGVHKNGGPTTTDNRISLSTLSNRGTTDNKKTSK